jgi:transglutaminase-like putative cysteine protease
MAADAGTAGAVELIGYGPPADWVELAPFNRPRAPGAREQHGGLCLWLSDTQISLLGPKTTTVQRSVNEVMGTDGLQSAAVVNVTFDPGYETLTFHRICVVRDGQERLIDPRPLAQVFRREPDLERAIYDGRLTANLTLPDIRVGDIVDVAFSLTGDHPVIGRHFNREWLFSWSCFVGETRVRLLAPMSRRLIMLGWSGAPAVQERQLDGACERIWRSQNTAPVELEPDMPSWLRPFATIKVCDETTWPDVAARFAPLYATGGGLPPGLDEEVAALADLDPKTRAVGALRLVQGALRYQSVSLGEGGFAPRDLTAIWGSRSGDCKDASRLLVAILTRLGLSAYPVLVNTWRGWILDQEPASLLSFDHCIVGLALGGETFWLDPTMAPQGENLATIYQPRFGWGLPLKTGATLVWMGSGEVVDLLQMEELISAPQTVAEPVELEVRSTYFNWRAEMERRRWDASQAQAERDYLSARRANYGDIELLEPIEVVDERKQNGVRTRERYRMRSPWVASAKGDMAELFLRDGFLDHQLSTPETAQRRWPIELGRPRRVRHDYVIALPAPLQAPGWDETYEGPSVRARLALKIAPGGREARLIREIEFHEPFLAAEQASAYFRFRAQVLSESGATLRLAIQKGRFIVPPRGLLANIQTYWGRWLFGVFWAAYILAAFLDR